MNVIKFKSTDGRWHVIPAVGPIGPDGADGAPGASAYELAVAQGYTGTLAEWLAEMLRTADIANNLTTEDSGKVLSALQEMCIRDRIETVRNLIGGYEELDKKRAYSSMVSALENEAQVAEIQKDIAYEAYFTAKQRVEQYDELKDHLGGISDKAGMREYTENIETGLPLLQDYIRVMSEVDGANPFANLDTSNLTDLETFLNNFGGWDALLKLDPSAIQDGTGAAADRCV